MAEQRTIRGSSTKDECPKHRVENSLLCKAAGCQRNICPLCMMKDHRSHDVIAPENGFVYCSDPSTVDTTETLIELLASISIKLQPQVALGNGNQQSAAETKKGCVKTGKENSERNPEEKVSPKNIEIVYNREDEEEKGSKLTFFETAGGSLTIPRHHCLITKYKNICYVSQIQADNSFVVCGRRKSHWRLVRHIVSDGTVIDKVALQGTRPDVQEVVFEGRPSIAVSYGNELRIDFHEIKNFGKVLHRYFTGSVRPRALCAAPPDTLICTTITATAENKESIYWMDCSSKGVLQYVTRTPIFRSSNSICYIGSPFQALITADTMGLHATLVETPGALWTTDPSVFQPKTSKVLTSLTTNGRDLVFAVDAERSCVQLFSAINGHYLGYLIKEGEFGIGHPLYVNWCENTSTLIVVHLKGIENNISFLKMCS